MKLLRFLVAGLAVLVLAAALGALVPRPLWPAAMAGQGVMLAWDMVVADALALGRLVRPFDIAVESCLAYWFVTTAASTRSRKVRLFRDWLKREIAATGGRAAC